MTDYFVRFDWGGAILGSGKQSIPIDEFPVSNDSKLLLKVLYELWKHAADLVASAQPVPDAHKILFRQTYDSTISVIKEELGEHDSIVFEEFPDALK